MANVQDIYPLAPLQEGMLFHHQLQQEGDAYVTPTLLAFDTRERLERYFLVTLSGGNDLFAYHFGVSLNAMTWVGRIGLIVLPPLAYFVPREKPTASTTPAAHAVDRKSVV